MRTPFYPQEPSQAQEIKWYMKQQGNPKPRNVVRNRRSGKWEKGCPVDKTDIRLAPTGVSVVFASYEPHNKRQDMTILLHPVMYPADSKTIKFLSTFRQEIGPCVLVNDGSSGIKGGSRSASKLDMLYPPAAIYGTDMDWFIIAEILAFRRHAYLQQRPYAELCR